MTSNPRTLALGGLLLIGALWLPGSTRAATLEMRGDQLWVSGTLDGSAADDFKRTVESGVVRLVVFENSSGGTAEAARVYASVIAAANLPTELHGQCQAACAYAFLAGREHRFGRGLQVNTLLIPVATRPARDDLATRWRGENALRTLEEFDGSPGAGGAPARAAIVAGVAATPRPPVAGAAPAASAGAMAVPLSKSPLAHWRPEHGVLFTSTPTLFGRVYNTYYCDGNQGRDTSRCEVLNEADPYKLGVLTP